MKKQNNRKRDLVVYSSIVIIFFALMFLIFYDSTAKNKEKREEGINTELPEPTTEQLSDSKIKAFRDEADREELQNRLRSMDDYMSLVSSQEEEQPNTELPREGLEEVNKQLIALERAKRDDARSGGHSYSRKEKRVEYHLESKDEAEERIKIIEKTYSAASQMIKKEESTSEEEESYSYVRTVDNDVVSSLSHNTPSTGFNDAMPSTASSIDANTIKGCIDQAVTLSEGERVKIRLQQPLLVESTIIPKGHILSGIAKLSKNRLTIIINSIEFNGRIMKVKLSVYDKDGNEGIYCKTTTATTATKQAAGNVASNISSGLSVATSAQSQVAMGLTRGIFSSAGAALSSTAKRAKVRVSANYEIFLIQK